jgi:hypothetical protein
MVRGTGNGAVEPVRLGADHQRQLAPPPALQALAGRRRAHIARPPVPELASRLGLPACRPPVLPLVPPLVRLPPRRTRRLRHLRLGRGRDGGDGLRVLTGRRVKPCGRTAAVEPKRPLLGWGGGARRLRELDLGVRPLLPPPRVRRESLRPWRRRVAYYNRAIVYGLSV